MSDTDWQPAIPAICPTCKAPVTACKRAHDRPVIADSIPAHILSAAAQQPISERVRTAVNHIRMNDDLLERASVLLNDDDTVTISAEAYRAIMIEAGWKQR